MVYINMSFSSDDDYVPLHYETPSPYKKRRPPGLTSKRKSSKFNKKLDNHMEEIMKIEDKYHRRILENINKQLESDGICDEQQRLADEFILNSFSGENKKTMSATLKDVISPVNSQTFKNYFSPNHYFNKFNQDSMKPTNFFGEHSVFANLTNAEIIELIKTDSLDTTHDLPEKNELEKFLLFLGSVTQNILIADRITKLLPVNNIQYLDFITIIENWGRVNQTKENNFSQGRPQLQNFVFVLEKVMFSIKQYTLSEIKDIFRFLINASLDSLLINEGHSLLQPLHTCIHRLSQRGLQNEDIVDLIDYEQWNIHCTKHVVLLLLNCNAPNEIAILLGFRALSKLLVPVSSPTTSMDMESLFQILLIGEEQLIKLDLQTFLQSCIIFELIAYKIPNRQAFDIWRIIRFVEKIKRRFPSEIKSVYFSEIINRMRIMWND